MFANVAKADLRSAALRLEAPFDVQVLRVPAARSSVQQGDEVMTCSSFQLDQLAAVIDFLDYDIEVTARPLTDGRLDREIDATAEQVKALEAALRVKEDEAYEADTRLKAGQLFWVIGSEARYSLETTRRDLIDVTIRHDQARNKRQDLLDRLGRMKHMLALRRSLLEEQKAALVIRAPRAGTFEALALPGMAVHRGHVLGTVS